MLTAAAWNGNIGVAEWLVREVDAPWPAVLEYEGMTWPADMVQW
jgi:hypothetical protein